MMQPSATPLDTPPEPEGEQPAPSSTRRRVGVASAILFITFGVLSVLFALHERREDASEQITALADEPKTVEVVPIRKSSFRETRTYVGTLRPWVEAKIGPQLNSAYVQSVLVRPGDRVTRGEVLATLDCRDAAAATRAVRMAAKALEAERAAHAREAARMNRLAELEHVSRNEADLKIARSEAEKARALAAKAKLLSSSLRVDDCVLKSPIDGEVIARSGDPGSFIRPGESLLVVVDRSTVRVEAHAPERDFASIEPETPVNIRLLATGGEVIGKISRRTPGADASTRTVRFEVDIDNSRGTLPVGTTAYLQLDAGVPIPAIEVPLVAASVRGGKATMVVVEDGRARKVALPVIGEFGGSLFVEPKLPPGTRVVTRGRNQVRDGDLVVATESPDHPAASESAGIDITASASSLLLEEGAG